MNQTAAAARRHEPNGGGGQDDGQDDAGDKGFFVELHGRISCESRFKAEDGYVILRPPQSSKVALAMSLCQNEAGFRERLKAV